MRTPICESLGVDLPIFGFSHCRDVVAAISRAGGFGVLGAALFSPEQLELELAWIDEHVAGRPYGLDVVIPATYANASVAAENQTANYLAAIPQKHWEFVQETLQHLEVPELPDEVARPVLEPGWNPELGRMHFEVGLGHPIRMIVNALGTPPAEVVERAHAKGMLVGGLAGKPAHAVKQVEGGVDVIIAQGTEAGGHTGEIATMVLTPQVVRAVGPDIPVLAAGGIASGEQLAAAIALGAQGGWLGSVWLTTHESDVDPAVKQRYLAASSDATVRTKENSGKPCRGLRTPWRDAWLATESPGTLPMPLQGLLTLEAKDRIKRARRVDLMHMSVGQVVGQMNHDRSVADVMFDLTSGFVAAADRLAGIVHSEE
ncbi:MAG: nitronate monooxygenase family protein [Actinomycetota bacterium]|nr:nitronate monooxygenase family protein [Actinomycetota bacterium]